MSLDIRGFERQLAKANGTTTRELNKIERQFNSFNKKATGSIVNIGRSFGLSFAGLASGALLGSLRNITSEMSDIADNAIRAGIAIEDFQAVLFAAKQSGVDQSELTTALAKLNKTLGEARSKGNDLKKIFEANGIAIQEGVLPNLLIIADLIKNAKDEQDQAVIGAAALGRGYAELLPILVQGSQAISGQMQAARDAGAVIDEELVKAADEFDDAWERVTTSAFQRMKRNALVAGQFLFEHIIKPLQDADAEIAAAMGFVTTNAAAKGNQLPFAPQTVAGGKANRTTVVPDFKAQAAAASEALRNSKVWLDAAADAEREYARSIEEASEKLKQQAEEINSAFTSAIQGFISDIMRGESAVDSLSNALKNLLGQLTQIAVSRGMQSLFAGGGPGALAFHRGGVVGKGGSTRFGVSPLSFAGAPRMHNGGIAGNEVPAILKKGEVVLPGMPRMGGQGANVEINIVNKSSAEIQQTQRTGPDGQRIFDIAVMDVVGRKLPNMMTTRFGIGPRLQQRG